MLRRTELPPFDGLVRDPSSKQVLTLGPTLENHRPIKAANTFRKRAGTTVQHLTTLFWHNDWNDDTVPCFQRIAFGNLVKTSSRSLCKAKPKVLGNLPGHVSRMVIGTQRSSGTREYAQEASSRATRVQ
mmetsp:Transcript_27696/g.85622  ORF Transcript_27696/g.85622 Transcript_27696/m.85622 type:complete len:129 (+) Transcript_27696:1498-1884(+)